MFGWWLLWKKKAGPATAEPDPTLAFIKKGVQKYAVTGTPTDCVMFATRHMLRDDPPELVLSGVNFGQNIAEDVSYSGTVAGAKEGTVFGIPSVALSQAISLDSRHKIRFEVGVKHGANHPQTAQARLAARHADEH